MENMLISLNVMLPVFLTILLGCFLRQVKLLPKTLIKDVNNLCFKFFLPVMLFNNIRATDFRQAFDLPLILFASGSVLFIFVALCKMIPLFIHAPDQQSVVIQGIYRSNYVILGIPIVTNIYGADQVTIITMLIAIVVPLFNLLAVILFEKFNGRGRISPRQMLLSILSNPLIVATAAGFCFTLLGFHFPVAIDNTLNDLAGVTIPLALLILGADLDLGRSSTNYSLLIFTALSRLLLIPAIFIPLSIFLGFRNQSLASLMVLFSSPAAVSGYIMAQNADADYHLAGQIVVYTSLLSCFTFFILIALLKSLHFI